MNRAFAISALHATLTTAIHMFAGGPDGAAPLISSSLDGEPKLTLYGVWLLVTVVLGMSAVAFSTGSFPRHAHAARYMVLFVSALWCCSCRQARLVYGLRVPARLGVYQALRDSTTQCS